MSWRARFRARKRRRLAKSLLPGWNAEVDADHEILVVSIPVNKALLADCEGDFPRRTQVVNHIAHAAYVGASQAAKERLPVKWPDYMGNKFKEGWKGLAAY